VVFECIIVDQGGSQLGLWNKSTTVTMEYAIKMVLAPPTRNQAQFEVIEAGVAEYE